MTPSAHPCRFAVLLMGPTGAGKSQLALDLVQRLPLEIISVDSAMVYRGMDIGTAKPPADIRQAIVHHLIDIRDVAMRYSAGEFVQDAARIMEDIWRRGRHPLLVGGTMLYFHALTEGIAELPEADFAVRADIDARAGVLGWPGLHQELARIDPQAAAKIHENDAQRIQRALEVHRITGEPMTRLQTRGRSVLGDATVAELALVPGARAALHARIEARFDAMLEQGFVDEVRQLQKRSDLDAEHPSMRAVGYRQLWRHLAGQCTAEDARTQAIAATRQLAKRQMTWLRARPLARCIDSMRDPVLSVTLNALAEQGFTQWS